MQRRGILSNNLHLESKSFKFHAYHKTDLGSDSWGRSVEEKALEQMHCSMGCEVQSEVQSAGCVALAGSTGEPPGLAPMDRGPVDVGLLFLGQPAADPTVVSAVAGVHGPIARLPGQGDSVTANHALCPPQRDRWQASSWVTQIYQRYLRTH